MYSSRLPLYMCIETRDAALRRAAEINYVIWQRIPSLLTNSPFNSLRRCVQTFLYDIKYVWCDVGRTGGEMRVGLGRPPLRRWIPPAAEPGRRPSRPSRLGSVSRRIIETIHSDTIHHTESTRCLTGFILVYHVNGRISESSAIEVRLAFRRAASIPNTASLFRSTSRRRWMSLSAYTAYSRFPSMSTSSL